MTDGTGRLAEDPAMDNRYLSRHVLREEFVLPLLPASGVSSLSWPLKSLLAAAVVLPLLVTAAGAWLSWKQAWREAERETAHAADAAAEYAGRVFDGLLLRLDRAAEILSGLSDEDIRAREADLHVALRRAATARLRSLYQREPYVFAFDRDAFPLVSGSVFPVPRTRSFADREFNQALRSPEAGPIHVSPVYVGVVTGEPFFALTVRRESPGAPDGATYAGVINASVYVAEAETALRRLASDDQGDMLALIRDDGHVLARSSPVPPGTRIAENSPLLAAMRRNEDGGTLTFRSSMDGDLRMAAYRRIGGYPVYASAARPRSAVVGRWAAGVAPLLAAGVPATLAMLGLALLVVRKQRALGRLNGDLEARVERRTAQLRTSEARLRELVGTLDLGQSLTRDMAGNIRSWSKGCTNLFGWTADEAVGRRAHDLLHTATSVPPRDIEVALLRDGTWRGDLTRRARDGREIVVNAQKALRRETDGPPVAVLEVLTDVTEQRKVEAALRASEERARLATEAARLGTWEFDAATASYAWSARLSEIMGDAPVPRRAVSVREFLGRIHPDDVLPVRETLRRASAAESDGRILVEYRVRALDRSWRWLSVRGAVLSRDPVTGAAADSRGVVLDVTDRKLAEARQQLLIREVDHRAKNALAVVLAAVRLADRSDADAFAKAIEGRVGAMARTHGLLADSRWTGADVCALARAELAPFIGTKLADGPDVPRVEVTGPALRVDAEAAQAFSMVLHELATNATKYGALSVAGGVVHVELTIDDEDGKVRLLWSERNGPVVDAAPDRQGFGTQVIEAIVESQLGGAVERDWSREGLSCVVTVALERVLPTSGGTDTLVAAEVKRS